MTITAVIGMHWGDEGKGKVIDYLVEKGYDAVARYGGACNAGHTVYPNGRRVALHVVPSGIFHPHVKNVIGNGVAIHPERFFDEAQEVRAAGGQLDNLYISDRCLVTTPYHMAAERLSPRAQKIGTTGRGVGPTFASHAARISPHMRDFFGPNIVELLEELDAELGVSSAMRAAGENPHSASKIAEDYRRILGYFENNITDTVYLVNGMLRDGKRVVAEGAQATLLDIDHGTYPDVTSSSAFAGGVSKGLGVPPKSVTEVVGVMKAGYITRVGAGAFPTELGSQHTLDEEHAAEVLMGKTRSGDNNFTDLSRRVANRTACEKEIGRYIRIAGCEYGATSGRPRRTGLPDMVATQYSAMLNGFDWIALTKLDVTDFVPEIKICTSYQIDGEHSFRFSPQRIAASRPNYTLTLPGWMSDTTGIREYDELPENAKKLIDVWNEVAPVKLVSNGPERGQTIFRDL